MTCGSGSLGRRSGAREIGAHLRCPGVDADGDSMDLGAPMVCRRKRWCAGRGQLEVGNPFPQQTGDPSKRRPHVWRPPLLIEANRSASGGDDWPKPTTVV